MQNVIIEEFEFYLEEIKVISISDIDLKGSGSESNFRVILDDEYEVRIK